MTGDFANTTEVAAALAINGSHELSLGADAADLAQGDAMLILWDDGTNSFLATLTTNAAINASAADTFAATATVTNLMQFNGIETDAFGGTTFEVIA